MFDNHEKLENVAIFGPGATILTLAKNWLKKIVIIFDELSNVFFSIFVYNQ